MKMVSEILMTADVLEPDRRRNRELDQFNPVRIGEELDGESALVETYFSRFFGQMMYNIVFCEYGNEEKVREQLEYDFSDVELSKIVIGSPFHTVESMFAKDFLDTSIIRGVDYIRKNEWDYIRNTFRKEYKDIIDEFITKFLK
ncbi:hypothetical protein CL617_00250 [archaeon]|nr:hypothetical protein [archaeon]